MIPNAWKHILGQYGPVKVELVGSLAAQLIFFWQVSMIYTTLPFVAPSFSERHKIQPAPKQPTFRDIIHCAAVAGRNQLMFATLAVLLFATMAVLIELIL